MTQKISFIRENKKYLCVCAVMLLYIFLQIQFQRVGTLCKMPVTAEYKLFASGIKQCKDRIFNVQPDKCYCFHEWILNLKPPTHKTFVIKIGLSLVLPLC